MIKENEYLGTKEESFVYMALGKLAAHDLLSYFSVDCCNRIIKDDDSNIYNSYEEYFKFNSEHISEDEVKIIRRKNTQKKYTLVLKIASRKHCHVTIVNQEHVIIIEYKYPDLLKKR